MCQLTGQILSRHVWMCPMSVVKMLNTLTVAGEFYQIGILQVP